MVYTVTFNPALDLSLIHIFCKYPISLLKNRESDKDDSQMTSLL